MKKLVRIFVGLAYLLPIKFIFLPVPTNRILLYFFTLLLLIKEPRVRLYKGYGLAVALGFLVISYLFLIQTFHGVVDVTIHLYIFESIVLFPLASYYLVKYFIPARTIDGVVDFIINVMTFQAITILIMIFLPPVKDAILSVLKSEVPLNVYFFRHVGWTGFSAYNMGVFLNFSLFFVLYQVSGLSKTEQRQNVFKYFLKLLLIISASTLVARTGIVILGLTVGVTLILAGRRIYANGAVLRLLVLFTSGIALAITVLLLMAQADPRLSNFLEWSFDIFISLFSGKEVQGVEVLSQFYWEPSDKTFLFGDGRYSDVGGGYYMGTDAGYMRILLLMGVFGSFAFYGLYILQLTDYFFNMYVKNKTLSLYFLILILGVMVINYKGNIFVDGNEMLRIASILFVANILNTQLKDPAPL